MAAHWLVHVHGVQAGHVKARQPHVAHDHHAQGVVRFPEAFCQDLTGLLVANVRLPTRGIGCGAGHHDLQGALVVSGVVPLGTDGHQGVVQLHTDAPAHADDHRLAVQGLEPPLIVLDNVLGDQPDALLRADERLQLGPLGLVAFLLLNLLALGDLLELLIEPGPFGLVQCQAGKAALVIDGHGSAIGDGTLDIVHADIVTKDGPGVLVRQFDRRAREANKGGVRQGLAHAPRQAVGKIVLAAVGFICDDDDIRPAREDRVGAGIGRGRELVDRGKDHAA